MTTIFPLIPSTESLMVEFKSDRKRLPDDDLEHIYIGRSFRNDTERLKSCLRSTVR